MPGGSSAAKEEPVKAGSPPFPPGSSRWHLGWCTGKDDRIFDPIEGSLVTSPANATAAEGVH